MGHLIASWSEAPTYPDGTPFPATFGFEVSVGTAPGVYTRVWNVGTNQTHFISQLTAGQRYYVGIRAYDGIGNFSAYTEVSALAAEDDPMPQGGAMNHYRVVGR